MPVKLLLCTDLDRTLLPNGPEPESAEARDRFSQLATEAGVVLVYVTGRDQALVMDAIEEYQLPQPDFVIADVGSTIYQIKQAEWHGWDNWEQEIAGDWQGRSHDEVHALFAELPSLTLQEQAKQKRYKLSYYVPLEADHQTLMSNMHTVLLDHHISANLIWSIDELADTGLLDVLPASASKRHAIEYLMQQLDFGLSNTIFAGDSGNDMAVLTSPIRSVLVANASDEVRHEARQMVLHMGQNETLYFASGGFLEMNGNYSAGILEGVVHFMPEVQQVLEQALEQAT
ncbi:MAG: HAD-IIB family hydrolase [Thiotrichales bacterium]|nr:MAG: HAD-IIB family hydrolase [Thiotrichales bacterium]